MEKSDQEKKNPKKAAVMSLFVPCSGLLYANWKKYGLLSVLYDLLILILIFIVPGGISALITIILWLFQVYLGYKATILINKKGEEPEPKEIIKDMSGIGGYKKEKERESGRESETSKEEPLEVLRSRLSSGEISKEEFKRKKELLEE